MNIKVMIDEGGFMPQKAHETDAGFDLFAPEDVRVGALGSAIIPTKVHMLIMPGYCGMLKSKSGLNMKNDLLCEGVVDALYTGEIVAKIYNHSNKSYEFKKGDKITQIVIAPIPDVTLDQVDEFDIETERGSNGFGSSGR